MSEEFKAGDRVQINPAQAERFKQPWRSRIERGLFGVVQDAGMLVPLVVELDRPKNAKYPHDWFWTNVRSDELIRVEEAQ